MLPDDPLDTELALLEPVIPKVQGIAEVQLPVTLAVPLMQV